MLTGPGPGVSRSRAGGGAGFPAVCCLVSEPSVLFPSFSYLPDHSEHKDGHVSGLGCDTAPCRWRVEATSALSRVSVGS